MKTTPKRGNGLLTHLLLVATILSAGPLTPVKASAQEAQQQARPVQKQQFRQRLQRPVSEQKAKVAAQVDAPVGKTANPPVNEADSLALVALYNSTGGASWTNRDNWLTGRLATWYGITVMGDRVTALRLPSNNLVGSLPADLGDLTALTTFNLGIDIFDDGENHLSGSIPAELGNLTELTLLWLDGNQLTGPIPSSLGNLTKLESLDFGNFFGGNRLSGPIPSSLGNLTSLESLRLVDNDLSGPIPSSLGSLASLEYLELGGNELSGSIPSELGNLANLLGLELGSLFGGNHLSGTIPSSLGNLQNLELLYLAQNELEGPIPPELGQLGMLESLSLSGNKLTGSIPVELGNLSNLDLLDLGLSISGLDDQGNFLTITFPNLLSGEIPAQIGNLTKLEGLFLASNAFTGAAPSSLAGLPALGVLMLNCNRLEDLPALATLSNLETLLVENNLFTFADVVPNVGVPSDMYTYSPQASVPVTVTPVGGDLVISVADDEANNRYQWYVNGVMIAGADEPSYTISAADPNGAEAYHVEITNTVAAELTLSSLPTLSKIIVNDPGDESDAVVADGVCDIDTDTEGLQCTLRAALEQLAQGNSQTCGSGGVEILFDGVQLIQPDSPLPTISNSVVINGGTGGSRVEIRGSSAGTSNGLTIEGQGVVVRNLIVNEFSGWGIRVSGGSGHVIENSRIGVLADEMPNAAGGILVDGGARIVTIGGLTEEVENIVGGGIRIMGPDTQRIRVLRNILELSESALTTLPLTVPIDLGGDGPTCSPWANDRPDRPNLDVPPPRVLEFTSTFLRARTRPSATVVAYSVEATGIQIGRYWARSVIPVGVGVADGEGAVQVDFDYELTAGAQITLTTTDLLGNTSELSQVRRPVVFLPGVGGSWLEGANGDNLFLPTGAFDNLAGTTVNQRLGRLAMNETGTGSLSGEVVNATGILEESLGWLGEMPYRPVLQHLQNAGFVGQPGNTDQSTLDLWRFAYDWRRDPAVIADDLQALIVSMTSLAEGIAAACEVDIATHSNGGMVASAYVWKNREHSRDHVNRLFMSAAPYLGTPQVAAAHTRGYLFDVEKSIHSDFNWGDLVNVFLNLPDGYGLLPSRNYFEVINPNAPLQTNAYLVDLIGNRLTGYQETYDFMTAAKVGPFDRPLGLGRNGTMWTSQQTDLHDLIDDWTEYEGPPQVFRHVGRVQQSTTLSWDLGPVLPVEALQNSTRNEVGDDIVHVNYRESLLPRLGLGDGTVALVSATLGGGTTIDDIPLGVIDLSGQESPWIEPFEYFLCSHVGMVTPGCNTDDGTVNALDRMTDILKSSYEYVNRPAGKSDGSANRSAASGREVIYIRSSSPIAVSVTDDTGARTGPIDGQHLNQVAYEIPEIGYWANLANAVISVPPDQAFTVVIESAGGDAGIRVSRSQSDGNQVRNIFFDDQTVADGGSLRLGLTPGGTSLDAVVEVDADGNGIFEGDAPPLAQMMSTKPGPSIPEPLPFTVKSDIQRMAPDPVVLLTVPDVGGPVWNWSLEDVPAWVTPDVSAGQNPSAVSVTLAAATLPSGIHRDAMTFVLTYGDYTSRIRIPIELAIRDEAAVLESIVVQPTNRTIVVGDSIQFWVIGRDQLGLPITVEPMWSASGGSINGTGRFIAGMTPGVFEIVATGSGGAVSGSSTVEIIGGVATEKEETLPSSFELYQNYPNPFNPTTTIYFALPGREHVRLTVYDLLGRQVASLIDEVLPPGYHRIAFDAGRYPTGMYLYRVNAGASSATGKMILLK